MRPVEPDAGHDVDEECAILSFLPR
jgi:hypothetical protein